MKGGLLLHLVQSPEGGDVDAVLFDDPGTLHMLRADLDFSLDGLADFDGLKNSHVFDAPDDESCGAARHFLHRGIGCTVFDDSLQFLPVSVDSRYPIVALPDVDLDLLVLAPLDDL